VMVPNRADGQRPRARILAVVSRDAGFEVVYTLSSTPEQIAAAAIQEDVDLVGLSCFSGAHRVLFPRVVGNFTRKRRSDITVIGGGIIPEQDFLRFTPPHLSDFHSEHRLIPLWNG